MKEEHKKGYQIFKILLGGLFKFWYNPKITGGENIPDSCPTIICANHLHLMDQCSIIISTKRMIHYLAKKEYFDGPFAWFFKATGCISVDRSTKDPIAKKHALELLKKGYVIGIFPEGTRNKSNKILLPLKFGAVSLASKTDAMIVPVGISGTYKFRSKDLTVNIGKPFKVTNMSLEEANELLKNKIIELIKKK